MTEYYAVYFDDDDENFNDNVDHNFNELSTLIIEMRRGWNMSKLGLKQDRKKLLMMKLEMLIAIAYQDYTSITREFSRRVTNRVRHVNLN